MASEDPTAIDSTSYVRIAVNPWLFASAGASAVGLAILWFSADRWWGPAPDEFLPTDRYPAWVALACAVAAALLLLHGWRQLRRAPARNKGRGDYWAGLVLAFPLLGFLLLLSGDAIASPVQMPENPPVSLLPLPEEVEILWSGPSCASADCQTGSDPCAFPQS